MEWSTEAKWSDIVLVWYVLIDEAYRALEREQGARRQRDPTPTFHDSEVITVGLLIDTFFGGNEELGLAFLRQYEPSLFPHLPSNSFVTIYQVAGKGLRNCCFVPTEA